MEELKEKILKNYGSTIALFITKVLKTKGYVRTPNNMIFQLNVFDACFDVVNIEDVIDLINVSIPNLWNVPGDIKDNLINEKLRELLPTASILEINHYVSYVTTNKKILNQKELNKKVKQLLKKNKKKHKSIFKGGVNAPEYQAQALINRDVFYCKLLKEYYIFVKNRNQFVKLTTNDILKYIKEDYPKANLTKIDIADYMKTSYLFFVTNSDLPKTYNENQNNLMLLKDYKRDYDKVNIIISRCE